MNPTKLALPALALLVASEARAYVCTPVMNTANALTQAWNQRCIPYFISRSGTLFSGDERRLLIANSFRQWATDNNACTDLTFLDAGYTDNLSGFNPSKPDDQQNVIATIEDPAQLALFPDQNLLAITLTSFSTETGEIFDADILVNAVHNKFDELNDPQGCNRQTGAFDLANTLVHEMGHFIGFDHETDVESTMFASAERCEIKKRDLSDDDKFGICHVYGKGEPTMTCRAPADYDAVDGKPDRFRDQCDRLTGNNGGCDCTGAAQRTDARDGTVVLAWSLLAVGSVVLWNRRKS